MANPEINDHQEVLFVTDPDGAVVHEIESSKLDQSPLYIPSGEEATTSKPDQSFSEGVSVNLRDYYVAINGLFTLANSRNTSEQFLTKTADPASRSYYAIKRDMLRRGKDIEEEIGKSQQNKETVEAAASKLFADKLFKSKEMVDAGVLSKGEADARASKGAKYFKDSYFGERNKKVMLAEKKRVGKKIQELDSRA